MIHRSLFRLVTTAAAFLAVLTHAHGQSTKVMIREWDLPKPNTFPHDPLATPDGSLGTRV